jgi:sigma-B regulation protein RsbU (phosphoserine phosphatase)
MLKLNDLSNWHQKFETLEEVTQHLQKILIDFKPIQSEDFEVIGFNRSSDLLGGDYIGVIPKKNGKLILSIGDVMGKGVSAGFLTGMIHGALKGITLDQKLPEDILASLNSALIQDFQRFNSFATFLVSVFDSHTKILHWANAGQNFPILWRNRTRSCELLSLKGVMIGVIEPIVYKSQQIQLEKGDIIFFYSDGLVELLNKEREPYGVNRVIKHITDFADGKLEYFMESLQTDVLRYSDHTKLSDDISFIALKLL